MIYKGSIVSIQYQVYRPEWTGCSLVLYLKYILTFNGLLSLVMTCISLVMTCIVFVSSVSTAVDRTELSTLFKAYCTLQWFGQFSYDMY